MKHVTGLEPAPPAWKAGMLPITPHVRFAGTAGFSIRLPPARTDRFGPFRQGSAWFPCRVGRTGVEPVSCGSSDRRSDRISYQPIHFIPVPAFWRCLRLLARTGNSSDRNRTCNPTVNSRVLYRLSYRRISFLHQKSRLRITIFRPADGLIALFQPCFTFLLLPVCLARSTACHVASVCGFPLYYL